MADVIQDILNQALTIVVVWRGACSNCKEAWRLGSRDRRHAVTRDRVDLLQKLIELGDGAVGILCLDELAHLHDVALGCRGVSGARVTCDLRLYRTHGSSDDA